MSYVVIHGNCPQGPMCREAVPTTALHIRRQEDAYVRYIFHSGLRCIRMYFVPVPFARLKFGTSRNPAAGSQSGIHSTRPSPHEPVPEAERSNLTYPGACYRRYMQGISTA